MPIFKPMFSGKGPPGVRRGYLQVQPFSPLLLNPSYGWEIGLSTLFQDSNGTTAAVTDADPVGYFGAAAGAVNALQATAGSRPVLKLGVAPSGANAIRFTAASSQFLAATLSAVSQPYTTTWAGKWRALQAASIIDAAADSQNGGFVFKAPNTGAVYSLYGGTQLDSATVVDTSAHACLGVLNGASSAIYLDGVSIKTGNVGSSALGTTLEMGRQQGSSHYSDLDVYAVWVFPRALTATPGGEIAQLSAYFRTKFGTP